MREKSKKNQTKETNLK